MTTGDLIAIVAVGINVLAYAAGLFKLNATVNLLKEVTGELKQAIIDIRAEINDTKLDVAALGQNCKIFHGLDK